MLFQGVDGANVPPTTSSLYWTVVVLVKCSYLTQSSPNLPPPSAVAAICFVSLVIGPPLTWRHCLTVTTPALSVPIRVVTLIGLHWPAGARGEESVPAIVGRKRSNSE